MAKLIIGNNMQTLTRRYRATKSLNEQSAMGSGKFYTTIVVTGFLMIKLLHAYQARIDVLC
jgi:hypothetical protein